MANCRFLTNLELNKTETQTPKNPKANDLLGQLLNAYTYIFAKKTKYSG